MTASGTPLIFLRNVKPIFEEDDLTIVNLEGPLTTSEDLQEKHFLLKENPNIHRFLRPDLWRR